MNKGSTYIIIIISIIAIASIILYVKYELPKRSNIEGEFSNLSISAKYNGNYIETILVLENGETHELKTNGYEFIQLRKGIYNIYNKNEEKNFYQKVEEYNISEDIRRIDFELDKPEEVITKTKHNSSIVNVKMSSENFQNVKLCLKHTISYIFVNINTLEEIDLLDGYEDWDKCYSLDKSLGKEEVNISYRISRIPEESDFINMAIIDTEYVEGKYRNEFKGKDLGGEDIIVKIKS